MAYRLTVGRTHCPSCGVEVEIVRIPGKGDEAVCKWCSTPVPKLALTPHLDAPDHAVRHPVDPYAPAAKLALERTRAALARYDQLVGEQQALMRQGPAGRTAEDRAAWNEDYTKLHLQVEAAEFAVGDAFAAEAPHLSKLGRRQTPDVWLRKLLQENAA
jgi:uncharacterized Zn finger protein (UPF0148 family)